MPDYATVSCILRVQMFQSDLKGSSNGYRINETYGPLWTNVLGCLILLKLFLDEFVTWLFEVNSPESFSTLVLIWVVFCRWTKILRAHGTPRMALFP